MCPMCIGAATWYVAGMSSAGGIAALVLKRARVNNRDAREGPPDRIESKREPDEKSAETRPGTPGT